MNAEFPHLLSALGHLSQIPKVCLFYPDLLMFAQVKIPVLAAPLGLAPFRASWYKVGGRG